MSLKAELETWAAALKAYDDADYEKSLELFASIGDSSKILTNMGLIYATLGEHEAAVEQFIAATQLDQFLAVAYFQCGVSNFLLQRYELAFRDFDGALLYLRGNENINYEQLGLKFKLYSAEVLFNKGLCQVYMGQLAEGMGIMEEARREKATQEHNVIDDAIADRGDGYTVFSIVSPQEVRAIARAHVRSPSAYSIAHQRTSSRTQRPKITSAKRYVLSPSVSRRCFVSTSRRPCGSEALIVGCDPCAAFLVRASLERVERSRQLHSSGWYIGVHPLPCCISLPWILSVA